MQESKQATIRRNTGQLTRVTVGIVLLVLLLGLWACLWVPPSIF
jgi:hypothetical protein